MAAEDNMNWCGGNGQMLSIGTDGRLFPCIRFMKYSLNDKTLPEFEIGNVKKGIDKEEDNKFLTDLSNITRSSQSTDKCINCEVASGCAWCTGYNYDVYKTPNKRATFICEMHKARVLANYYYWNKLNKKLNLNEPVELNLSQEDIEFITKGDTRWQNF
jgi:radical SAM protein with 4Fe4S-binding SPASM domain